MWRKMLELRSFLPLFGPEGENVDNLVENRFRTFLEWDLDPIR